MCDAHQGGYPTHKPLHIACVLHRQIDRLRYDRQRNAKQCVANYKRVNRLNGMDQRRHAAMLRFTPRYNGASRAAQSTIAHWTRTRLLGDSLRNTRRGHAKRSSAINQISGATDHDQPTMTESITLLCSADGATTAIIRVELRHRQPPIGWARLRHRPDEHTL